MVVRFTTEESVRTLDSCTHWNPPSTTATINGCLTIETVETKVTVVQSHSENLGGEMLNNETVIDAHCRSLRRLQGDGGGGGTPMLANGNLGCVIV